MEKEQDDLYRPVGPMIKILNFKADDPATHTESRFLNHFLRIYTRGVRSEKKICQLMGISHVTLRELLRAEAGTSFQEFVDYMRAYDIHCWLLKMRRSDEQRQEKVLENINLSRLEELIDEKDYDRMHREVVHSLSYHQEYDYQAFASLVGFQDRSSLWRFTHSKRYLRIVSELGLTRLVIRSNRREDAEVGLG